jgi:gamma-glutamylcyclotransferase (GGCT)/AIG2-like uncharacterized protein YtfP
MLYFAYGMNTNADSMADRCPSAQSLGHARLLNHVFRFSQHADVIAETGSYVDGVLWEMMAEDLMALDWLEGYPDYYTRSQQRVAVGGRIVLAYVYHMQPGNGYAPPSQSYLEHVIVGYQQHSVPQDQLWNAAELATEVGKIN